MEAVSTNSTMGEQGGVPGAAPPRAAVRDAERINAARLVRAARGLLQGRLTPQQALGVSPACGDMSDARLLWFRRVLEQYAADGSLRERDPDYARLQYVELSVETQAIRERYGMCRFSV